MTAIPAQSQHKWILLKKINLRDTMRSCYARHFVSRQESEALLARHDSGYNYPFPGSWQLGRSEQKVGEPEKKTEDALGSCGQAKTRRQREKKKQGRLSSGCNICVTRSQENRIMRPCNYTR